MRNSLHLVIVLACFMCLLSGAEKQKTFMIKPAPIPAYNPARQPVVTGEFPVGLVVITFKESENPSDIGQAIRGLEHVTDVSQESGSSSSGKSGGRSSPVNIDEYFKIYSGGISWPKIVLMHDESTCYQDPHFYGYYCEYDYWENPIGWKDREEGEERVKKMNQNALRFTNKAYRGEKPRFICYNYVTTRATTPTKEVTAALLEFYQNRGANPDRIKPGRLPRVSKRKGKQDANPDALNPWDDYAPICRWGEPMWPNSKIQIDNFAGGVLAHELGHCLGAPDVYRIGRFNDGIGGDASLLAYGPTANAFSRFYHHAFIKEKNHPILKSSGTFTLHPRDITPKGNEVVGYLIPSNHPHYLYHVEYVHQENGSVGVGPGHDGMVISVVNLGLENYLGSPDYFYVYRPNDPFFLGKGGTMDCLFGKSHQRPEFNMNTEPSSRLPNLLDGGVAFKNIEEHGDTLTFDVEISHHPVTGSDYVKSMLPQIRLDSVRDVQSTSFSMDCTIKFRGEPLMTTYGFCWSISQEPTVRDDNYLLAHRECYRGHAINLNPDTTYHVRAFITNGIGYRYSDEELTVKTPAINAPPHETGPLLTDYFSNDAYLFNRYSREADEDSESYEGYSPTCALSKFIAYYRPAKFRISDSKSGPKAAYFNFDEMSWNPSADDFPMRLDAVDEFFAHIRQQGLDLGFHDITPGKDFIRNLVQLTGVRSKPVLSELTADNIAAVSELVRKDLAQSRPVLLLFSDSHMHYALVDGIDRRGLFHVDFAKNAKLFVDEDWHKVETGYGTLDMFMLPTYKTWVVTSCYYPK